MEFLKSTREERIMAAIGVVGILGLGAAAKFLDLASWGLLPECPFHKATGLDCPGCGLTRGVGALLEGDIVGAVQYNALIPLYLFVFGYFFVSIFLIAVRGRGLTWAIFRPSLIYGSIVLALLYAVARNLPYYPFNMLAI